MPAPELAYLIFGGALCAVFLAIIIYYYSKKRHEGVEAPKYTMMEDDD